MNAFKSKKSFLSRMFPVPKYLTLNPVALDLSSDSIRVCHLKDSSHGLVPDFYKEVKLKEECAFLESGDDIDSCNEVKSILADLKKEFGFRYVSVSLSESRTYIFKTSVPKSALDNIEEALSFKIEENVPFSPNEVIFDYKIMKAVSTDNNVDVVVSVVPKTVIEMYTRLLEEVGIVPVSFKPDSTAMSLAIIDNQDMHPYLIINLAEKKVALAIVEQQVIQYTSSFPISSKDITEDFNGSSANGFKEHVNKLLVYWFTNKHDPDSRDKIQTAIVVGEYANSPGLTPFLENKLKINVEIANIWKNCFDINDFVPEISKSASLSYATVVGLALD